MKIEDVELVKAEIRQKVWKALEESNVAAFPKPVSGRIPNFIGSNLAAKRLVKLSALWRADVVKVNPDSPQQWVRRLLLRMGKTVVMPTPRMREGFLILDPRQIGVHSREEVATIRGALTYGRKAGLDQMEPIDFIVEGSVAVNELGGRLGKGEGYAEIEYGLLREVGVVSDSTPIATTVHDLQFVGEFPLEPYDVPVDIIVTPTRTVDTHSRYPRPEGIIWHLLSKEKISQIPLLSELASRPRT